MLNWVEVWRVILSVWRMRILLIRLLLVIISKRILRRKGLDWWIYETLIVVCWSCFLSFCLSFLNMTVMMFCLFSMSWWWIIKLSSSQRIVSLIIIIIFLRFFIWRIIWRIFKLYCFIWWFFFSWWTSWSVLNLRLFLFMRTVWFWVERTTRNVDT